MLEAIALIILGLCAVPSLVLAKRPDAQVLFDKVSPYQGWLGVFFFVYGIWGIINAILNIHPVLTNYPISWSLWMFITVVMASLGFIMGFALINTYALSKNPTTEEKGKQLLAKLQPLQGKIGVAAIVIGVLAIIGYLFLI